MITITTKNLIAGWITIILEPLVKLGSMMKKSAFSSELSTIIINVIESQKKRFGFSATGATIATISLNSIILKAIVIAKGMLPMLSSVGFVPLCSTINFKISVVKVISFKVFFQQFLRLFTPLAAILKNALLTLSAVPAILIFCFVTFRTSFYHGFTSLIIKNIYDYKNNVKGKVQRLFRKEVGASVPKRIATRSVDDIVCSIWKHVAALISGLRLTTSSEHKDQNKAGFCIGSIYGVIKSVFNGADIAVVGMSTYRTSN
jgi:hypothetical protein